MTDASHVSPTYAGEPPQPCDDFPACVSFDAHGLVPVVVQQEGWGIGLYLARLILEQEKGYVKVDSRPGEGSTFSVFLPLARKEK